jgi:PhzF family phenazine biosynthesis protein
MRYIEANEDLPMTHSLYHVDAFTDTPFAGNPAAVCVLREERPDAWMQQVAREMNLSETAFVRIDALPLLPLRWFTPATEVPLCGHATLASAHVFFNIIRAFYATETITFQTQSGELRATKDGAWLTIDLPARPVAPAAPPFDIAAALGGPVAHILANQHGSWLVEVANETHLRGLAPDFAAMGGVHGVIVTCRATTPGFDFISRYFAPSVGVQEDPVTGTAHCSLAPYWAERLGKTTLTGYQASPRGGVVRVRLADDRVFLSGQCVTISSGFLAQ